MRNIRIKDYALALAARGSSFEMSVFIAIFQHERQNGTVLAFRKFWRNWGFVSQKEIARRCGLAWTHAVKTRIRKTTFALESMGLIETHRINKKGGGGKRATHFLIPLEFLRFVRDRGPRPRPGVCSGVSGKASCSAEERKIENGQKAKKLIAAFGQAFSAGPGDLGGSGNIIGGLSGGIT